MRAVELYEKETGNKSPNNQIAYHEWHIDYVKWLEQNVVKNISSNPMLADVKPLKDFLLALRFAEDERIRNEAQKLLRLYFC
jgi:hypothetical protein